MARCFHCKQLINTRRDSHAYVPYRTKNGVLRRRWWCHNCNTDENVDKEYPTEARHGA